MFHILRFITVAVIMTLAIACTGLEDSLTETEQEDATPSLLIGNVYWFGDGVEEGKREAVYWFRKAAEQGDAQAQFNLGVAYWNGEGIAQDQHEAVRWYRKAAEQGSSGAQNNLGVAYDDGEGIAQDQHEAVRWYRKAAEQGDTRAQHNLGLAYWNGEGIARDKREAVRWFRKVAEQGDAQAQYNLGIAYDNGKGIAEDKRKAVRWYRKAAEQGYAQAQFNLGVSYWYGNGIARDKREAVRWFRKVAEQGFARAQNNLGVAYWNGEGVITDKREAYIWYSIAKASGDEKAATNLRNYNWHDYLSQREIRSAQKEAARRFEAIENRRKNSAETPAVGTNTAIIAAPKEVNTAAKVFENAWQSVVVVVNGDNQGSGVIVHPSIVATNCHVVSESSRIAVYKSDNRRVNADTTFFAFILISDEDNDFCLLDVLGLRGVPATVRRYDTLKVGEDVYGLGAPRGLDLSLSDGIVSQLREVNGFRVIQTNVAISPGSSGGGLFDSEGNLVGIMTEKIADEATEGIGFAIPADLFLEL